MGRISELARSEGISPGSGEASRSLVFRRAADSRRDWAGIENRDRAGAPPVVVLNQEVTRQLSKTFGIANPVGRTVGIWVPGYGPIPESLVNLQIVGVIRGEHTARLHAAPEPVAYLPLAQAPRQDIKLVIRTRSGPAAAMPGIWEAVRQVDPNLPLRGRHDNGTGQGAEHALGEAARLGGGRLRRGCGFAGRALGLYGVLGQ
jgi:hypothetical protein